MLIMKQVKFTNIFIGLGIGLISTVSEISNPVKAQDAVSASAIDTPAALSSSTETSDSTETSASTETSSGSNSSQASTQDNPLNDCTTSSGECPTTPTKFSTTVYRVALCTSSPMPDSSTTVDWEGAGCVDVYNNPSGEETGDIFSSESTLSAEFITIPAAGSYSKIVALVDKTFKMASHHMVMDAGSSNATNGTRYVSTSTGGAIAGTPGSEAMYEVNVNTFAPQLACSGAYTSANSISDVGVAGNGFVGRLLNSNQEMSITGSGSISNETAVCNNVKYILSIVDNSVVISSDSQGVELKIQAKKGTAIVDQGDSGNGEVTGFSGAGASFLYDVTAY